MGREPNDAFSDGFYKPLCPDYMPGALLPAWGDYSHSLADCAFHYAILYVALTEDNARHAQYYLKLHQSFGDPSTVLRLPQPLTSTAFAGLLFPRRRCMLSIIVGLFRANVVGAAKTMAKRGRHKGRGS